MVPLIGNPCFYSPSRLVFPLCFPPPVFLCSCSFSCLYPLFSFLFCFLFSFSKLVSLSVLFSLSPPSPHLLFQQTSWLPPLLSLPPSLPPLFLLIFISFSVLCPVISFSSPLFRLLSVTFFFLASVPLSQYFFPDVVFFPTPPFLSSPFLFSSSCRPLHSSHHSSPSCSSRPLHVYLVYHLQATASQQICNNLGTH